MPTECSAELFDFGPVEGRAVEAAFDAGLVTSDAGALLLGATDRVIGLVDRFADCFCDHRRQDLIEHAVTTLIGQRVFGIALGYEDLNDHDELRHDPVMAVLAGKVEGGPGGLAPGARQKTPQPPGARPAGGARPPQNKTYRAGERAVFVLPVRGGA